MAKRFIGGGGRAVICTAAACVVGIAASAVRAETLADVIALAYQSNPTLQEQRARLRAIDETYVQARAGWLPTVSTQVTGTYSKGPGGSGSYYQRPITTATGTIPSTLTQQIENNVGQVAIGVTQPIYTGGRTASEVRATEADVNAARQGLRAIEASLLQNVVTAYADVLRDQAVLAIREHDLAVLQSELDDSRSRFAAGEVTATDVAQTEAQLAESRSALAGAQGQLQISRANYAAIVGQNPGQLAPITPMPGVPATVDIAFQVATEENPSLRQAEITEEASSARVAEARAANRPTVSANANIGLAGGLAPFYGPDYNRAVSASVTVTMPIFNGGLNSSNIRRALELNTSDRIGIEVARRAAVQAVSQAWNQLLTYRTGVTLEQDHVRAARNYFSGTQAELTVGQRSTLDVIIAEQSLVGAEISLAAAQHDADVAQAALLSAMGRLEMRYIMVDPPLYDSQASFRHVVKQGAVPWEGVISFIDQIGAPSSGERRPIVAPKLDQQPMIVTAVDPVGNAAKSLPATASPTAALPGTTSPVTTKVGKPRRRASFQRSKIRNGQTQ